MVLFGKVTEGFLPIECGTRSYPSFDYIQLLHLPMSFVSHKTAFSWSSFKNSVVESNVYTDVWSS